MMIDSIYLRGEYVNTSMHGADGWETMYMVSYVAQKTPVLLRRAMQDADCVPASRIDK
jgi:hypothetical protein